MKYVGSLVTTCYCFIFCFAFCCSALKIAPSEKHLLKTREGEGGWIYRLSLREDPTYLPTVYLYIHPFPLSFSNSIYLPPSLKYNRLLYFSSSQQFSSSTIMSISYCKDLFFFCLFLSSYI